MEPEVWIIVREINVCHGHGDYVKELVLAYDGYDSKAIYPAFMSSAAANGYLDGVAHSSGLRAHKLELREE